MSFEDTDATQADDAGEAGPGLSLGEQAALEMAPKLDSAGSASRGVDWRDVVGKIWNAPNTVLGLAYGGLGMAAGEAAHLVGLQRQPAVRWRDNAVQFVNNPLGGVGAVTLGNTTTYRGDPYDPTDPYWYPKGQFPNGADPATAENGHSIGQHEQQHTVQGQQLGPAYLPSNLAGGIAGLLFDRDEYGRRDWHGAHNWNEVGPQMNPPRPWPGAGA